MRQTLFALRALLEPLAPIPRPVIVADRAVIGVVDGALGCDAVDFERAVREGRYADALTLYAGELLPGHYDEWVDEERLRLAGLADRAREALADAGAAPWPPRGGHEATGMRSVGVRSRAVPFDAHSAAGRLDAHNAHNAPAAAERERSPLPLFLTRFFGREAETAALAAAIAESRLVTLLGPGGCGKTRLVAEACRAGRAAPPEALTLFLPLVGCATRPALVDALTAALRLPAAEGDALARIAAALDARPTLLVLDNFEQLVDAAGDVVARLLAALPDLRVLATSRRALGLDGERRLTLAPLPLPPAGAPAGLAAASPAVSLFVDRARAVRADFHLGERNAATLAELVAALDGLPLAIELAASRVRSVSPAEMLAHLRPGGSAPRGAGLALLARSGVRAGLDGRHASMLRTIEWSWNLLPPPLQRLLAELTVFEGGFTAEAAAAVGASGNEATPVVVMLDELVSHSLLAPLRGTPDPDADGDGGAAVPTRFALDESIRTYAAAMLDAEAARAARGRHRRWLVGWGEAARSAASLEPLRAELRNVAAAVASALADAAPREAVAAMLALGRGLPDLALPATLLADFERSLDAVAGETALASRGHTLLARLHLAAAASDAARLHAERGLALARSVMAGKAGAAGSGAAPGTAASITPAALLARALQVAASVVWRTGRDAVQAEAWLDEAEPLATHGSDPGVRASARALRAFIANVAHRDLARAEALHAEALALWQAAGDAVAANNGRYNLAVCAMRAGRHDEALQRTAEVASEAARQHDWRLLSQARNVAGEAHAGRRDWPAAADAYRQSLELAWNALAQPSFAYALWNLPFALARQRRPDAAARLGGAAAHFWATRIGDLDTSDRRDLRRLERLLAVQIGAADVRRRWSEGAALPLPEVVALALRADTRADTCADARAGEPTNGRPGNAAPNG